MLHKFVWSLILVGTIVAGTFGCSHVSEVQAQEQNTPTQEPGDIPTTRPERPQFDGEMSRPQFDQAHHGGRHPGVQAGVQALVGHAAIQTTSDLTGLPLNEVLDELLSGKSLAQIAEEHAQSGDAIVEAVVAKAQERLDNAVESGRMTRERADEMLERLTERITDLVNDEELGAQVAQRLDRMVQASLVRATAQVTDLAPFDIIQQVQQDNTSLADVITEAGYTVQEVLDIAETVVEARLNVAVATERMTRAEADTLLTLYSERAAQLINE